MKKKVSYEFFLKKVLGVKSVSINVLNNLLNFGVIASETKKNLATSSVPLNILMCIC